MKILDEKSIYFKGRHLFLCPRTPLKNSRRDMFLRFHVINYETQRNEAKTQSLSFDFYEFLFWLKPPVGFSHLLPGPPRSTSLSAGLFNLNWKAVTRLVWHVMVRYLPCQHRFYFLFKSENRCFCT